MYSVTPWVLYQRLNPFKNIRRGGQYTHVTVTCSDVLKNSVEIIDQISLLSDTAVMVDYIEMHSRYIVSVFHFNVLKPKKPRGIHLVEGCKKEK